LSSSETPIASWQIVAALDALAGRSPDLSPDARHVVALVRGTLNWMAPAKGIRIGGRQKGTPNKVNVATRERIMREADPIAFWRSDHVPGKCRSVQLLTPFPIKPERLLCGLHHPKWHPERNDPAGRWLIEQFAQEAWSMDKDRVAGAAKEAGGKIKETAGKVVGDKKMEDEGSAKKTEGEVQNAVGGAKDAAREFVGTKK
jgi:uncharacterized protein YjbJ (UPF0337 family)